MKGASFPIPNDSAINDKVLAPQPVPATASWVVSAARRLFALPAAFAASAGAGVRRTAPGQAQGLRAAAPTGKGQERPPKAGTLSMAELLISALDQSGRSVLLLDRDGRVLYANESFRRSSGYPQGGVPALAGGLLESVVEPDVAAEIREALRSGRAWRGEVQVRRPDGRLDWERLSITAIRDDGGAVFGSLIINEEITSEKEAERDLLLRQADLESRHERLGQLLQIVQQAKREWEQTVDCVDDMVVIVDSRQRVKRCNRAFADFLSLTYRDIVSSPWPELTARIGLEVDPLSEEGGELFHEGSGRWLGVNTYPYGESGEGRVVMLHDLTQIKAVSEQLEATHLQLLHQEKMASIGQLAAGVAHEINNPIGYVSSNLGTMVRYMARLEKFLELQSAALEEYVPQRVRVELAQARQTLKVDYLLEDAGNLLAESQDGAERVRKIVQNLKSFSHLDHAEASFVDLNGCLDSTINIAWNELKYKTTLRRDYGELPAVKCLPHQLNQVFLNILINAAHAIEKQGEITVTTRSHGERVSVAIHDNGPGIPEEITRRIFEPFFTTKEVGKGTGLGLSISYDIIKNHNGSIEVESSKERGTTFTIFLPVEGVRG